MAGKFRCFAVPLAWLSSLYFPHLTLDTKATATCSGGSLWVSGIFEVTQQRANCPIRSFLPFTWLLSSPVLYLAEDLKRHMFEPL